MSNNIENNISLIKPTFTGLGFKKRPMLSASKLIQDSFVPSQKTEQLSTSFLQHALKKIFLLFPVVRKNLSINEITPQDKTENEHFISKENLEYIPLRRNQQFSKKEIKILQNLPDEQYKKAQQLFYIEGRKKQFNLLEMEAIYTLSDEKFEQAKELLFIPERGESQFSAEEINAICVMYSPKFHRIRELVYVPGRQNNQFDMEGICKIANLSEKEYRKAKELFFIEERGEQQLSYKDIISLSCLSDVGFNEANEILHLKNCSIPFDGDIIIRILEFEDLKKERIYKRNLLSDVDINGQKDSLSFNEISFLSDFDDDAWVKIQEKNLFDVILNSKPSLINSALWQKILKLADKDLSKALNMITNNSPLLKFFDSTIVKKGDKVVFDEEGLFWAQKFDKFTEKGAIVPIYSNDMYTKSLRDENGNIKKDVAEKLFNFLTQLKNDNYKFYELTEIFRQNLTLDMEEIIINKTCLRGTTNFNNEDLEAKIQIYEKLKKQKIFKKSEISSILSKTQNSTLSFIQKLIDIYIPQKDKIEITKLGENKFRFLSNQDISQLVKNTELQIEKMKKNPEQYINGFNLPSDIIQKNVASFIQRNKANLILASAVFDKETLNSLLRLRFEVADNYLHVIKEFNSNELTLLSKLTSCNNIYNKPFLPMQKIRFIDLINAYKNNQIDFSKMSLMAEKGVVDITELNIDLLKSLLKIANLSQEEIENISLKKLLKWDINNLHLLAKEVHYKDKETLDVLRIGSLTDNFLFHILRVDNLYSEMNYMTKLEFIVNNLNYEKWIKPSQKLNVLFKTNNTSKEQLFEISKNISQLMNQLLNSPAKNYIEKQLPKFISNNNFELPCEYKNNENNLLELLNILTDTSKKGQLYRMWQRALVNIQNSRNITSAGETLNILHFLKKNKNDLLQIKKDLNKDTLDLTIKMWDRNPQKDIFQGNYSTCCIGMGCGNGSAMPNYLVNTTFNMIEIVDNKTNEIIGNALCYFAKNSSDIPVLIIDNIEINNAKKDLVYFDKNFRKAIFDYARNIAIDVAGRSDTLVYLGSYHSDVTCVDLGQTNQKICPIGQLVPENTYLDTHHGWLKNSTNIEKVCPLYISK